MDEQEREEKEPRRFDRKRADLRKLTPHEIKPMNRLVAGGIVVGSILVGLAGWYVTHHWQSKPENASPQAEAPGGAAREEASASKE